MMGAARWQPDHGDLTAQRRKHALRAFHHVAWRREELAAIAAHEIAGIDVDETQLEWPLAARLVACPRGHRQQTLRGSDEEAGGGKEECGFLK